MRNCSFLDGKSVWVTSHTSPVGSAIVRRLWRERCEILLADGSHLDLSRRDDLDAWLRRQRPNVVFLAGRSPRPDDDLVARRRRLIASTKVVAAACSDTVGSVVDLVTGLGLSSRHSPGFRTGQAAIRLSQRHGRRQDVRSTVLIASGIYDPRALDAPEADALVSLFQRLRTAAQRKTECLELDEDELLPHGLVHVDDLADAAVFLAQSYIGHQPVHFRTGENLLFREVAAIIADRVRYRGRITLATRSARPFEPPVRSVSIGTLGWSPEVDLAQRMQELHALRRRAAVTERAPTRRRT